MKHDDLRQTAVELARLGGEMAASWFGRVTSTRKADGTPVTEADHAVQEAILAVVGERHPDHAILVEEAVPRPERHRAAADADYCWVVDPIDGTRNYARGMDVYAVSVAVLRAGEPVAGAVFDATGNAVYSAVRGGGAFFEDKPLRSVDRPIGRDTTVALSSFRHRPMPQAVRPWLDAYLFRNLGSLCLHLVRVASGIMDAAYARECKLWDIAAGSLLITEAGGRITSGDGSALWPIDVAHYDGEDLPMLAGTPTMHARLLQSLQQSNDESRP